MYAAESLVSRSEATVEVDIFDRLPVPFGLVRYGVAPDHLSIRGVRDTLDKTLDTPGVRFIGNVTVGQDVTLEDLRDDYDAVLLTYGASSDQRLGIPGEDLPGSIAATDLVAWYCGHPDAEQSAIEESIEGATSVVVVGVGNVAVDVARILAKAPGELDSTDMPQHVLEALSSTQIEDIHILGRRGPAQASFTTKELRELGELVDVDVIVRSEDLDLDPASADVVSSSKVAARNLDVLREWAARAPGNAARRLHLHFFSRPLELKVSGRVDHVVVERTSLDPDGSLVGTGETVEIPAQLVVRSVGYRGLPIDGVDLDDRSGTIANDNGRVLHHGAPVPGVYVAGWIKRGPTGIIGTNKKCAVATVDAIMEDAASGDVGSPTHPGSVIMRLKERGADLVTADGWRDIDAAERTLGALRGRDRTTIHERSELIRAAQSSRG